MNGIRHNHVLDGKLHDRCPGCAYIKSKRKRDKAHKESDADLKAIHDKAVRTRRKRP